MKKIMQFLTEHAAAIVAGAIALVSLILVIILFTLASSGSSERKVTITDVTGSAFILKNDGQISANRKMTLESGDVLITSAESTVKLNVDRDKYIYMEPETTMYIYYTDTAGKGSIVVNISEGAVVSRIDSKLSKNEAFEVRTPNAVVSAAGTVFRTQFDYYDAYSGYYGVKVTDVQCADSQAELQLYDNDANPVENLMLLGEGKCARLMTCMDTARYEYLNSDTDINNVDIDGIRTFIRIAAERRIAYSLTELNASYQRYMSPSESVTEISTMFAPAETEQTTATSMTTSQTAAVQTTASETTGMSEETTVSVQTSETTVTEPTTVSTAISVTSPTTKIYTVSTSASAETGESTVTTAEITSQSSAEATVTAETSAQTEQTSASAVPPIRPAASSEQTAETTVTDITTAVPSYTAADTQGTTVLPPVTTSRTTVPWWEIINSEALQ